MTKRGRTISYRSKLLLLCVSIAVTASALIGVISYRDIANLSRDRANELLDYETRLNGERLLVPFRLMQQDAAVVAGMPPVADMLAILSGASRASDGSGLDDLRKQVEVIFASQLAVREHYFKFRLIDLSDNGREVARLDVIDGATQARANNQLRTTETEVFIQPLLGDDPPRTSYFSTISRNRENGVVPEGSPWTINLVHPVAGPDNRITGALIISSDYDALIKLANLRTHPNGVIVTDFGPGDYVAVGAGEGLGTPGARLVAKRRVLAIGSDQFRDVGGILVYSSTDWTRTMHVASLPGPDRRHDIRVSTALPTPVLMETARETLHNQVLVSVLILGLTAAIASAVGVRLTRPLSELTKRISQRGTFDRFHVENPSGDEIGRLASAFAEMSNDLIRETGQARLVFEHAVDGLLTTDGHGRIISVNPAVYDMFGHPPGSLEGQPISRLIPLNYRAAHDGHVSRLLSTNAQPMAGLREVQAMRADGVCFPVEVKVNRVSNDGGGLFVAVVHDISQRREAEEQQRQLIEKLETSNAQLQTSNTALETAKSELERSNAELDKFAYVASHDLRAPLRVIDNASRWLEEDLAEFLDDDTRDSMELLRSRVLRMEQLLQDLLDHCRIGRVNLSDTIIDGSEIIENIKALTALPENFRFDVSEGFEAISLPQFPIQTVLVNLVSNAVKHHDRPDGRISLSVTESETEFVFEVQDDGPGIPDEFHEKVFDMFQTLKPRDDVEGSGMGLAIVKKTVEVAGGSVALTSAPGQGSLFRITWPRHPVPTAQKEIAA